jgi:hypothetical protein
MMNPFARLQQEARFGWIEIPFCRSRGGGYRRFDGLCDLLSISSSGDVTGVMRGSCCSARAGRCAGDKRGFRS